MTDLRGIEPIEDTQINHPKRRDRIDCICMDDFAKREGKGDEDPWHVFVRREMDISRTTENSSRILNTHPPVELARYNLCFIIVVCFVSSTTAVLKPSPFLPRIYEHKVNG